MRKIAFGYSTRCNIKCSHCVAADERPFHTKMELARARGIIGEMALAGVTGISFTAGEPFIYFDDLLELVALCREKNIYTRIVTNSFWAKTPEITRELLGRLRQCGLGELRLSYSRWHQHHVPRKMVLHAARGCMAAGIAYFVSFVTDFSEEDDSFEQFLRDHGLKFFPEPVIYAGRADAIGRSAILTDYQDNRCAMNPYLAPDLNMYACCDAGSHFNTTNFFLLGNLKDHSLDQLFARSENHPLYTCIRHMGITNIASFAGIKSREIVTYRKCELCKKLFDSPETLKMLGKVAQTELPKWIR
ncbi:MAG: Fe-S oxidoreductase [Desulfobulbaceae bacterium BRH_c16a]|nr:MAG: Fe-S oxidoreductase [Desulfobulbaceae bacterium BRH_c16a]